MLLGVLQLWVCAFQTALSHDTKNGEGNMD